MNIGATLTPREVEAIRKRLQVVRRRADDRRILEQCRLIHQAIGKAERRAARKTKSHEKDNV